MQDDFSTFFARVLKDEGTGYEDVPGDNGGPTKCGVTIADVARYNGVKCPQRGYPGWADLMQKVKDLSQADAGVIYKRYYWDDCNADKLPAGLDYAVVDYAVNSGPGRAIPVLGRLVGCPGTEVSDAMLAAIANTNVVDVINKLQDERRDFLTHLADTVGHDAKFKNGWLERVERVRKIAISMAVNAAKTLPTTPVAEAPVPELAPETPIQQPKAYDQAARDAVQAQRPRVPSKVGVLVRSRTANALALAVGMVSGAIHAAIGWLAQLWDYLPDAVNHASGQIESVHRVMDWFNIHSHTLEYTVAAVAIISAFALLASDKQKAQAQ